MPQHHVKSRNGGGRAHWRALAHAASRTALAACLVCAAGAARAGDDTQQDESSSVYDTFLHIIGIHSGPDINYSERSPLVVPPTKDLPPPSANAAPPAPDWPKDPDVARRAQARVKDKPKPHADYATDLARPMRPDELNATTGSTRGRGEAPTPGATSYADYPERDYTVPKKNIFDWFSTTKQEYATFTGEPARTTLTDPPTGYMTPSADQPYGIGPDQKKYKVPTVADRASLDSGTAASTESTTGH